MPKFSGGDAIDSEHCTVLRHEILRCQDSFEQFRRCAEIMILKGQSREISYRAYNAYTSFIHHLYEFLLGCLARDAGHTQITNKRGNERTLILDSYVTHHAQRVMDSYRNAIKSGKAPSWVNDIGYYDVTVPFEFAKDFREYRNKAVGHVAYERASTLSLTEFYHRYHKFLYYLYRESLDYWVRQDGEFPNLKEITEFSVMLEGKNS